MELTLWTYEGPPHVGAMRIASSMKDIHYVLHAPQGDTYADLLFTMIERRGQRPPVTYTTFQARDLGGDTAELVKKNIKEAVERFKPKTLLVGESCTAELIQDQPGALAKGMGFDMPIVERLCQQYGPINKKTGKQCLFDKIHRLDLMDTVWMWMENNPDVNRIGMDSMRELMGMDTTNAHDALQDVKDTANMMIGFMKLHRRFAPQIRFEKAFADGKTHL